jgi:hypothetical protein
MTTKKNGGVRQVKYTHYTQEPIFSAKVVLC